MTDPISSVIRTLHLADYWVADWLYLLILLLALLCLARGHRQGHVNLWDLVRTTKGDKRFTDARKLFETGAFVVTTVGFSHLVIQGKLTEFYLIAYLGAWVAARTLRDREQRLSKLAEKPEGDKQ